MLWRASTGRPDANATRVQTRRYADATNATLLKSPRRRWGTGGLDADIYRIASGGVRGRPDLYAYADRDNLWRNSGNADATLLIPIA